MEKLLLAVCIAVLWIVSPSMAEESLFEQRYQLSLPLDVTLTIAAAATSLYGNYLYRQMDVPNEDEVKDPKDLLPWDKGFAGRYSEPAEKASNYLFVFGVAPWVFAGSAMHQGKAQWKDLGALTLMLAQSLAIQNGVNVAVRTLQVWPRPYMYNAKGNGVDPSEKEDGQNYGSFYSGHASTAFTFAVFASKTFSTFYPSSPYRGIVWATSMSLASMVGTLRVAAGKHYPTDVVVGALMGTGISLGVLKIHESSKKTHLLMGYKQLQWVQEF